MCMVMSVVPMITVIGVVPGVGATMQVAVIARVYARVVAGDRVVRVVVGGCHLRFPLRGGRGRSE